ncbi:MAG: DUF4124 domain-containing protein [Gammaproteobacteria bacterium]|nr:MAG: DUF4124 domain-containing protein [Gammaproteobacteria bacterium]
MKKILFLSLVLIGVTAQAEVYRWKDANGKMHFSDKRPESAAENITEKVKQVNVDTSTAEHQKLETIFRKENDADREYRRQQAKPDPDQLRRCEAAKEYLRVISGRVQFIDNEGKIVRVTEEERTQKVAETQAMIKKTCP